MEAKRGSPGKPHQSPAKAGDKRSTWKEIPPNYYDEEEESLQAEAERKRANDDYDDDDSDEEVNERILDAKVEREWKTLASSGATDAVVSQDPKARQIVEGFSINWMNMKDGSTGRVMWESDDWGPEMFRQEKAARIPKAILRCRAVSREINFSSKEMMNNFRLEQRVFYNEACIEGSCNTWQQIIEAADADKMLPAEKLSGNLVIETSFYDGPLFLCKTLVRVYYV